MAIVSNWYCNRCRESVASTEVVAGKHSAAGATCGGEVEWKHFELSTRMDEPKGLTDAKAQSKA